jgi:Uma2 family endonuclease
MNTVLKPSIPFADYLVAEELATEKSEYYAGEVFTMAGGTVNHNLIAGNLHFALKLALKTKPVKVFIGDVKLYMPKADVSAYPDVFVTEGKPDYWNHRRDVVCNASLIVEVLSDSTQDYDRTGKFDFYRELPDFSDYLLVHQTQSKVEHRLKQSPKQWLVTEYTALEEVLELKNLGIHLSLYDIYDSIEFALVKNAANGYNGKLI